MPKVGMEITRRRELVDATIYEIGKQGSLEVTVGQIAERAGVSSGLAHHYFGGKDQIFLAAMRHILTKFGQIALLELADANGPLERLEAIIRAGLHCEHFEPEIISAWLTFYVQAQNSNAAARLLRIYASRLHSNLMHDLLKLMSAEKAVEAAHGIGALIDGFYIRHALREAGPERKQIIKIVNDYLHICIDNHNNSKGAGA